MWPINPLLCNDSCFYRLPRDRVTNVPHLNSVTSGGCCAFIYLFTYGKQVTNSIGHFFLFMQSVLLLHCPPTLISAGDFKLSLAFIETWKAEHLFLLLSHFIACASCFWHLGLLVREPSALVMSCLVWLCCTRKGDLEERSNSHPLSVCVGTTGTAEPAREALSTFDGNIVPAG